MGARSQIIAVTKMDGHKAWVPKKVREMLGIGPGDPVFVYVDPAGNICLSTHPRVAGRVLGATHVYGRSKITLVQPARDMLGLRGEKELLAWMLVVGEDGEERVCVEPVEKKLRDLWVY